MGVVVVVVVQVEKEVIKVWIQQSHRDRRQNVHELQVD